MDYLQPISIALESVVTLLALLSAVKGRSYLFGFAVTFGIYVYYDLARYFTWPTSESVLSGMFFVATLTALYSMWILYKRS